MPSLSLIVFCSAAIPAALALHLHLQHAHPGLVWALGYSSAIGMSVAVAAMKFWCQHTTSLMGKSPDGYLPMWSWVIYSPYHLGLRVKLAVGKLISKEPLWNRILPGWYLGGWPTDGSKSLPPGRPSVVDMTCELPRTVNSQQQKYAMYPVWDTRAPTLQQLEQAVNFCMGEVKEGRSLYIHCAHGHGRSATVMAAAFMEAGIATGVAEAEALMKSVRPKVRLSGVQLALLEEWVARRAGATTATKQPPIMAN